MMSYSCSLTPISYMGNKILHVSCVVSKIWRGTDRRQTTDDAATEMEGSHTKCASLNMWQCHAISLDFKMLTLLVWTSLGRRFQIHILAVILFQSPSQQHQSVWANTWQRQQKLSTLKSTVYKYYNILTALWTLSGTTRVIWYQKKHSPTHTYRGHQSFIIFFLHLL